MGSLSKHSTIAASPEAIFKYTSDPYNAPKYISSIQEVVSGPRDGIEKGMRWQARANFLGQPARIVLALAELQSPRRIVFQLIGDPDAVLTLDLTAEQGGKKTSVSLTLEVPSVPGFLLQGLMGGLLGRDMDRLKALMEARN